jgi:hypothetical protein
MAALCAWPALPLISLAPALAPEALVPMYRIDARSAQAEAAAAAKVASEIAERLRRLASAYEAWAAFEPGPYFDLRPAQTALLVRVTERVSTVHVAFAVDALLPSFQAAVEAGIALPPTIRPGDSGDDGAWTQVAHRWQHLQAVLAQARQLLADDIGYLATNAAEEERNRWRPYWRDRCAGMLGNQGLATVPSLTLATEFPLPAARQPHRLRRMRKAWEHRRRSRRSPGRNA